MIRRVVGVFILGCIAAIAGCAADPLPSWTDGAARAQIVAFVDGAADAGGDGFIPADERIAVFDHDGTLWADQPVYAQWQFTLDRVRALAGAHPEWRLEQPFRAVLEEDAAAMSDFDREDRIELMMAALTGVTTDELEGIVRAWIADARHAESGRRYTDLVYQPMRELLALLEAKGFRTYIVSGGDVEFMRAFVEDVYGIPPERVIGSRMATEFATEGGEPVMRRAAEWEYINDGGRKAAQIQERLGRRPAMAVGNSDGDFEMIAWTTAGAGPRLGILIRHTDGARVYSLGGDAGASRMERGLSAAGERGWIVVDTAVDWERVFSVED